MLNYQNGKVYKLVCDDPEKIYIGSTIQQLYKRLNEHKKKQNCSSSILFNIGGVKIILLENFPCNSKEELTARERYYFDIIPNVNIRVPIRNESDIERIKESNKIVCKNQYEKNKGKRKANQREYHQKNRREILEKNKERWEKNKKTNNEKITCECGVVGIKRNLHRHKKSQRHKKFYL